ncbi:MAG: hypothetical protein E7484_01505 [Ruminococcaceae bacterium]|nr:hypothetical protein [Oscillospiraceae bacterium]
MALKRLAAIILTVVMLCGCSSIGVSNNITGLLSSPKHSQTESLIVQTIGDYLGENITLKYSQTQGYSAPIQLIDMDGDKTEEALVFYYAPNKGTNIRFAFLKYTDEKWNIVFDKEGLGTEVFFFDTIVLEGVNGKQILVGYLPTNINGNFFVTYFTDATLQIEDYMEVCEEIFVADITADGYDDVIVTNIINNNRIRIKVLTFGAENTFKAAGTKVLKRSDVQITQMAVSSTYDGRTALYTDYADSYNKLYTEAGVLQGATIVNCLSEDTISRVWEYPYKLNSCDIDGDGVQDIPVVIEAEQEQASKTLRYIEWTDCAQKPAQVKMAGIYDTSENIFVALPQEWHTETHTEYNTDYWQLVSDTDGTVFIRVSKQEKGSAGKTGDYSYNINVGTEIWNVKFHESVQPHHTEFVLNNIKAFE